jgi:hypothetical protein
VTRSAGLIVVLAIHGTADVWYDNPWIIGVITGVASGAILALATPVFLRRRRARDIAIRRERAAEDVLSALRPSVATGHFPSAAVVESIVNASTYNRGLDPKYAVSASDLLDVLTAEVMASSFVSPESRNNVANSLLTIKSDLKGESRASVQKSEARVGDLITAVASALIGACIVGGASAVSVLTKNALVLVTTGSVTIVVLAILQFGSRIENFKMSRGAIQFSLYRNERE